MSQRIYHAATIVLETTKELPKHVFQNILAETIVRRSIEMGYVMGTFEITKMTSDLDPSTVEMCSRCGEREGTEPVNGGDGSLCRPCMEDARL